jgi:ubiquinone/menaquinone biosynthesis C-methylase UbiE
VTTGARAYDAIAEFYDHDMGRNADGRDVIWYREFCRAATAGRGGTVLELGCGTGRITLALAEARIAAVGIDLSVPMLQVLQRKAAAQQAARPGLPRPLVLAMDMARPALAGRFAAVLCPFSAFTYLLEDSDRRAVLDFVRQILAPGGRFAMDAFLPDSALEDRAEQGEVFDYRRQLPDGGWLERRKMIAREVRPGINRIRRRYSFLDPDGALRHELLTESHQRPCHPADLRRLLHDAGFAVVKMGGDFSGDAIGPQSRLILVEAEPEGR